MVVVDPGIEDRLVGAVQHEAVSAAVTRIAWFPHAAPRGLAGSRFDSGRRRFDVLDGSEACVLLLEAPVSALAVPGLFPELASGGSVAGVAGWAGFRRQAVGRARLVHICLDADDDGIRAVERVDGVRLWTKHLGLYYLAPTKIRGTLRLEVPESRRARGAVPLSCGSGRRARQPPKPAAFCRGFRFPRLRIGSRSRPTFLFSPASRSRASAAGRRLRARVRARGPSGRSCCCTFRRCPLTSAPSVTSARRR